MTSGVRRGDWLRGMRAEMHAEDVEPMVAGPSSTVVDTPPASRLSLSLPLSEGLIPPALLMSGGQEAMSAQYVH